MIHVQSSALGLSSSYGKSNLVLWSRKVLESFRQFDTSPTQGWGKVGARLGQGLDKKQGLGRQGPGKVRARLGQGPDKKQGSG